MFSVLYAYGSRLTDSRRLRPVLLTVTSHKQAQAHSGLVDTGMDEDDRRSGWTYSGTRVAYTRCRAQAVANLTNHAAPAERSRPRASRWAAGAAEGESVPGSSSGPVYVRQR